MGNTTVLDGVTYTYDGAGMHVGSVFTDGSSVTILRESGGSVAARTVTSATGAVTTTRYASHGPRMFVLNGSNTVSQELVSLPGGVLAVFAVAAATVFQYVNMHGDTIVSAGADGARVGTRQRFTPHGEREDTVTGSGGAGAGDIAGDTEFGYTGGFGKHTSLAGGYPVVDMGARVYVPGLGRFLQVDPVEGGVDNAYNYPNDPVNGYDLSGMYAQAAAFPLLILLFAVAIVAALQPKVISPRNSITLPPIRLDPLRALASIPRPGPALLIGLIPKKHVVYRIFPIGVDDTWKYGITGDPRNDYGYRPQSQLKGCAAYYSTPCDWRIIVETENYINARTHEYGLIFAYTVTNGRCPPGQWISCK